MADGTDWVERVAHIRAWQRDGERAPHKPLLLLYALGRLQREGANTPVSFAEAEPPLRTLLAEYGPPRPTSPGYPFHYLTTDGLWVVRTAAGAGSPGPNLGALRAEGTVGELQAGFARALLSDPTLLVRVARTLLDANFPPSLHDDIAAQVGLDLSDPEAEPVIDLTTRRRRSPAFRDEILMAYEMRCAICGWDGRLGSEAVGLEAAHIRWFNIGGPDAPDNGLCLCSLHHKLLDKGAIGITPERTVAVSARFSGRGPVAEQLVLAMIGKELARPQPGLPLVAGIYIDWHTTQVFRLPRRQAA